MKIKALRQFLIDSNEAGYASGPKRHPFRGPKKYQKGKFTYSNSWKGEVDRFSGEEKITQGKKLIYQANYFGGLVDQRRGV